MISVGAAEGRQGLRGGAIIALFFLGYALAIAALVLAAIHILPDQITVHLFGRVRNLNGIHQRVLINVILAAMVVPSILALECAVIGWRSSSLRDLLLRRSPSSRTDIVCFLIWHTHAMKVLSVIMTLGLALLPGVWLHNLFCAAIGRSVSMATWPMGLQVALMYLVYTFFDYWGHRLDHGRVFWPLHRFHHAADDFCIINSVRTHPASFSNVICLTLPLALFDADPQAMVFISVFVIWHGYLIHSRIDSNFGWIGRFVVQSPTHHRLHHALDISKIPVGHFGLAPIWDHLFGTWRGEADQTLTIGVETPYRNGFWMGPDILRDYWDFWRALAGRRV